jgi:hypothetical protein
MIWNMKKKKHTFDAEVSSMLNSWATAANGICWFKKSISAKIQLRRVFQLKSKATSRTLSSAFLLINARLKHFSADFFDGAFRRKVIACQFNSDVSAMAIKTSKLKGPEFLRMFWSFLDFLAVDNGAKN